MSKVHAWGPNYFNPAHTSSFVFAKIDSHADSLKKISFIELITSQLNKSVNNFYRKSFANECQQNQILICVLH